MFVQKPISTVRALSAAAAAFLILTASPALAGHTRQSFMPVGEAVEPPFGYFDFCRHVEADCSEFRSEVGSDAGEAASNSDYWDIVFNPGAAQTSSYESLRSSWVVADLSAQKWREVLAINRRVNGEISKASDQSQFGRSDFWARPLGRAAARGKGDCEDYVLQKRAELIEAGVPEGALSIAIAKTRRWEVHAVLLIATPSGEYVLDNRSAWVSRWYELNYQWERRQIPGSKAWVRVSA